MSDGLVPWWNLVPRAGDEVGPDPTKMLNAQVLAEKLRGAQQERQGYNALAQTFQDPSNLQNGLPNQNAMARVMAVSPQVGLSMMEAASKMQQQQQATAMNQQKFAQALNARSVEEMTPLLSQYDQDIGTIGKEAALQKISTERMATIDRIAPS